VQGDLASRVELDSKALKTSGMCDDSCRQLTIVQDGSQNRGHATAGRAGEIRVRHRGECWDRQQRTTARDKFEAARASHSFWVFQRDFIKRLLDRFPG
jgi:hypothetical protein